MHKGNVLSIDDDNNLQTVIDEYLRSDGYNVVVAHDVKSALEKVDTVHFDVILLDLVLPDGEGLNLIPQFSSKTEAAIIVVSGKSETTEKIVCLELGADDYMTKPFEMRELSARIRAILRRMEPVNDAAQTPPHRAERISFGDGWSLDRTRYQLFDKNRNSADLTTGQFKLLEALVTSPNRVLSREHLFELTRDGEFEAYDRAIDIQVARLRKKLDEPDLIKTVRGVGYMFCSEIRSQ